MNQNREIIFYFIFVMLISSCVNNNTKETTDTFLQKDYCDQCVSDTQAVSLEYFNKTMRSICFPEKERWNGNPLDTLRIETGATKLPLLTLEDVGFDTLESNADSITIVDYIVYRFNKNGLLETLETEHFGDLKQILMKISYIQDTIRSRVDIYSPIFYYPKQKPKESFIFEKDSYILLIKNNILNN